MEATVRRLSWIRKVLFEPTRHQQLLTAIFGQLELETEPTVCDDGALRPLRNEWAKRIVKDLEEACRTDSFA
eukprot:2177761-Pyramimonas_sp.AAC.1